MLTDSQRWDELMPARSRQHPFRPDGPAVAPRLMVQRPPDIAVHQVVTPECPAPRAVPPSPAGRAGHRLQGDAVGRAEALSDGSPLGEPPGVPLGQRLGLGRHRHHGPPDSSSRLAASLAAARFRPLSSPANPRPGLPASSHRYAVHLILWSASMCPTCTPPAMIRRAPGSRAGKVRRTGRSLTASTSASTGQVSTASPDATRSPGDSHGDAPGRTPPVRGGHPRQPG